MVKKITNEQIYKKLFELERIIKKAAKEEELLEKEDVQLEKKELQLLKQLHGKNMKKRFENILEWKQAIWDNCADKKVIDSNNKKEADFLCKKTEKSCRFIDCYKNKIK